MDGDERRHHQYGQTHGYQIPSSAPTNPAQQMPPPPPAAERYAQSAARVDTSRSVLSRSQATSYASYGFPEQQYTASALQGGAMQGVEMQYSSSYVHDASRPQSMQQQAPQQYTAYGQNVMMQPSSQTAYDPVPHYQQRQTPAVEVLTDRFGNPSYVSSNVQGGLGQAQYLTSQPEQVTYPPQVQQARSGAGPPDPQHSSEMSLNEQQYSEEPQTTTGAADNHEEEKQQYQQELKMTFEAIRAGKVNEASEKLMQISHWLLSSVMTLGLHHDEPDEYAARLESWKEFNLAWEALGLRQKDIFEEALRVDRQPTEILTAERIQTMVDELIALNDNTEQYGLVDYQMGVSEEQIVDIFIQCLDLFPTT